ncbi:hypothetical protein EV201_0281 [Ancylomarina subtilis]|uniref:Uncharacterized protein n=1 Tax=Ancylomarina subtilis TaxID=1639035 RepID=A0A4Q7VHX4_9BACT|nr:hypothetical protein EV201_0281 [Ancylomarina subtilis]
MSNKNETGFNEFLFLQWIYYAIFTYLLVKNIMTLKPD